MNKISYIDKVTIKVLLLAVITIVAIPYYFYDNGTIWGFIAIRIIASLINSTSALASHRWLCHNSFKPNTPAKYFMLFSMILSGVGRPLHIVIAHRLHHAHPDQVGDPHSPKDHSFLNLWLGRYHVSEGVRIPKDFFRIKEAVFVSEYYWALYILFNAALAMIDLKTALIFCPVTFIYSWTLNTIVNYYGHIKNGSFEPNNLHPILVSLTIGEGLHKNHHDYPSRYSFASEKDKDPGTWVIENLLMKK
jgi:fatty-acid desaturase